MKGALALCALSAVWTCAGAANILAVLTTPTRSHHIWSAPLMRALAARGHNVTVLSPTRHAPPAPGLTDIPIEGSLEYQDQDHGDYLEMVEFSSFEWLPGTFDWYLASCNYSLNTRGARALMDYPRDFRFHLIIIEASGGECLLGLVEKFGRPPVVAVNGFGNPQWVNWNMGNPDHPAYVPNALVPLTGRFSFAQTLHNALMYAATYLHYYFRYLPASDQLMRGAFGAAPPPASETLRNVSLLLVNAHYALDGARPLVPAAVPIAGIHIKEPKPLPKDLQEWLDGAEEGAVLFSLGSIVRSNSLPDDKRDALLEAFARLPRTRVLWKWEGDAPPPRTPPNVKTAKWLPQGDILAHPKVRAFVSHSGLLSTQEAVWRGVPVVALPFIVDQFLNAARLHALGVAERLHLATLTAESAHKALHAVLTDPGYRERMQRLSALFRSRPRLPLDTAVFWVEHVLAHGGAPRMRSPALDLPWYRLYLLDVAGVALAAAAVPLAVVALLLRCCLRRGKGRKEKAH